MYALRRALPMHGTVRPAIIAPLRVRFGGNESVLDWRFRGVPRRSSTSSEPLTWELNLCTVATYTLLRGCEHVDCDRLIDMQAQRTWV